MFLEFPHVCVMNRFSLSSCTCHLYVRPESRGRANQETRNSVGSFKLSAEADAKVCFYLCVAMVPLDPSLN